LEFARRFLDERNGLGTFVLGKEESTEECVESLVRENELGWGADAVIEASGAEAGVNPGIRVLRKGGHYVPAGLGKPIIQFLILMMGMKEAHCHRAYRYGPGDYDLAVELIAEGTVLVQKAHFECLCI
jgi:D-xylulose reductase